MVEHLSDEPKRLVHVGVELRDGVLGQVGGRLPGALIHVVAAPLDVILKSRFVRISFSRIVFGHIFSLKSAQILVTQFWNCFT
jgi:hypothetical protein